MFRSPTMRGTAGVSAALLAFGVSVAPVGRAFGGANTARPRAANGARCTIVGSAGNDLLIGTPRADVICGMAGNDLIRGLGGNDVLDGGTGNNVLDGGTGADLLIGGTGREVLNGGPGDDTLMGAGGADALNGGPGLDTASYADHTVPVRAALNGLANSGSAHEGDKINVDVENLAGGSGSDNLSGNDSTNVISGGAGNDVVTGGAGDDTISGGPGRDILSGADGNDTIAGGPGNDLTSGGAGNDALNGGTGADQVSGGGGADTLDGGVANGGDECDKDTNDLSVHNCVYDGVGPRILAVSYSASSIDTSTADQVVDVNITAWDASGVVVDGLAVGSGWSAKPVVSFSEPSALAQWWGRSGYFVLGYDDARTCTSDAVDVTTAEVHLVCSVTFPKGLPPGNWYSSIRLFDPIGNPAETASCAVGCSDTFPPIHEIGAGRATMPHLAQVDIAATPWDAAANAATVTADVWLTGANGCLSDPSRDGCLSWPSRVIIATDGSGTVDMSLAPVDDAGHFRSTGTVNSPGQWTVVELGLYSGGMWGPQVLRNRVSGSFGVTSVQVGESLAPAPTPTLLSITATPAAIDTATSAQDVTLTAHVTNATNVRFTLMGPTSGMEIQGGASHMDSGDFIDGQWSQTLTVPAHAGAGSWLIGVSMSNTRIGMSTVYTGMYGCALLPYGPGFVVNHKPSGSCANWHPFP